MICTYKMAICNVIFEPACIWVCKISVVDTTNSPWPKQYKIACALHEEISWHKLCNPP